MTRVVAWGVILAAVTSACATGGQAPPEGMDAGQGTPAFDAGPGHRDDGGRGDAGASSDAAGASARDASLDAHLVADGAAVQDAAVSRDASVTDVDGRIAALDAGLALVDASAPIPDAGIGIDAGPPCGTDHRLGTCPGRQVCVRECCHQISACNWVRHGEACPWPLHEAPIGTFTCPGIPGVPSEKLCVDGTCSFTTSTFRCADPPAAGDCTGGACALCGSSCTGAPPVTSGYPPSVICRYVAGDAGTPP